MPIDSAARICRFALHSSSSRASSVSFPPSLRRHSRHTSQYTQREGTSSQDTKPPPPHLRSSHPTPPGKLHSADAIAHLRKTFPPLEFPADVAQRITTHISWNRGVDGHNGRLGFVGRRVLHTYLLLFLHECSLLPQGYTPRKSAPVLPSSRLRRSALGAGGPIQGPPQAYDDISERLLNTYVLGEYVGAAWKLERIMRWTPAIAQLDTMRAASPDIVLRSSGLYKVRGATVEGIVGGIFHQFGGAIAHRVFHTRVLPHIFHLGLPTELHARAEEACERFGGREGLLVNQSSRQELARETAQKRNHQEYAESSSMDDPLEDVSREKSMDMEFTKVNAQQTSRERQRLGYVS